MVIINGDSPVNSPLTIFLVQVIIIVTLCRSMGFLFRYLKQPAVIAEVITGILLGPSVCGHIPGFTATIFPKSSLDTFGVFANFGLIIFMFIVGMELNPRVMTYHWKKSLLISATAMIAPFVLGIGTSYVVYITATDQDVPYSSFLLFVGVSLSITAFSILARILTDKKLLHHKIGIIAMSSAAVDDVTAWCVLALVISIVQSKGTLSALYTVLVLIGFVTFMGLVVRPLLARVVGTRGEGNHIRLPSIVVVLVLVFTSAWFTEIIGVHAIFGGFVVGVVTPRRKKFAALLTERIEDIIVVVFLPLYYTFSGLRTNIGLVNTAKDWGLVLLIIVTVCIGKIGGASIASRIMKNTWRESFALGILLNTKGMIELIVLNIGLDIGVLNQKVFTMFVLMALFSACATTPLFYLVYERHTPVVTEGKDKNGDFWAVLCLSDISLANWMGTVSSLFLHRKESVSVKLVTITEVSDRPSSLIYADLVRKKSKYITNSHDNPLLTPIKNKFQEVGVTAEERSIVTSKPAKGFSDYVVERDFNLVFLEIGIDSQGSEKQSFVEKLSRLKFQSPAISMVKTALLVIDCPIGVIVDKEFLPEKVEHLLFIWLGANHEKYALDAVLQIARANIEVHVTVVTKSEGFIELFSLNAGRVTVITVRSEEALDLGQLTENKPYDLVVMGAKREDLEALLSSSTISGCKLPILLLYPSNFFEEEGEKSNDVVLQELPE
jgi:Kef-type K+ transport system membrane component KefB